MARSTPGSIVMVRIVLPKIDYSTGTRPRCGQAAHATAATTPRMTKFRSIATFPPFRTLP